MDNNWCCQEKISLSFTKWCNFSCYSCLCKRHSFFQSSRRVVCIFIINLFDIARGLYAKNISKDADLGGEFSISNQLLRSLCCKWWSESPWPCKWSMKVYAFYFTFFTCNLKLRKMILSFFMFCLIRFIFQISYVAAYTTTRKLMEIKSWTWVLLEVNFPVGNLPFYLSF